MNSKLAHVDKYIKLFMGLEDMSLVCQSEEGNLYYDQNSGRSVQFNYGKMNNVTIYQDSNEKSSSISFKELVTDNGEITISFSDRRIDDNYKVGVLFDKKCIEVRNYYHDSIKCLVFIYFDEKELKTGKLKVGSLIKRYRVAGKDAKAIIDSSTSSIQNEILIAFQNALPRKLDNYIGRDYLDELFKVIKPILIARINEYRRTLSKEINQSVEKSISDLRALDEDFETLKKNYYEKRKHMEEAIESLKLQADKLNSEDDYSMKK